jgi:iron(III) transport system substrate-binding protein
MLILVLGGCRGDGRTPLTVYSPHGREQLVLVEKLYEQRHPEVDLRWLDMGSQEILDRVRFEKVNPQCDVWYGGPTTIFDRAVAENLLEPYRPTWAASVDPAGVGPGDLYWPVYRTPAVLAWNSRAVRPEEAPRDWDDVLDPKWAGRILIRDPMASGTMRAIWGWMILRQERAGRGTEGGFDWLRRLDRSTRSYVMNPTLLMTKLSREEGVLTLWDLPDILIAKDQGLPFGWAFPSSGTVVIHDPVAIVRGTKHRREAEELVELVGSVEGQLLTAREAHRLPARTDLPAGEVPDWVARVDREMVAAPVDWKRLAKEGASWMGEWDSTVRGRGAAREPVGK